MRNLMVLCPTPTDATSFYRGIGPLTELKRAMRNDLNLQFAGEFNWATVSNVDGVFMQRPFNQNHKLIAEMVKANNKPLWVDFDDDLFQVPPSNKTFRMYGKEPIQKNIGTIIAMADVVTVSTSALKRRFEPLNKKIYVVPNAFNAELFNYRSEHLDERRKLICWRGSDTHQKDLATYTPEMVACAKDWPSWTWNFIGESFWQTVEAMPQKNLVLTETVDPVEYFKLLQTLKPAVVLVPLHDCDFNRSKSNIAWIEGSFAGATVLAPNWEEWQRPGVVNYSNRSDFQTKLHALMKGEYDYKTQVKQSWEFIMENLTLRKVNRLREVLLRELLEM